MSSFYTNLQNTANTLLIGKGQTVTLTTIVAGDYNETTGSVTNTETTQTGTGVLLEYNERKEGIHNAKDSLIEAGDKKLLLSPLTTAGAELTAPQVNDKATVDGTVYTITQVKPLSPAGTPVLYECNLRGT